MDLASFISLVAGGFTGIAAAVLVLSKFFADHFADALMKKYDLRYEKELEKYKSSVENVKYVTQAHYDKLFEVYENLSGAFIKAFRLNDDVAAQYEIDSKVLWLKNDSKLFDKLCMEFKTACQYAEMIVYQYVIYIQEDQEKDYLEIMKFLNENKDYYCGMMAGQMHGPIGGSTDGIENIRINEAEGQLLRVNEKVRDYLLTLEVIR